MRLFQDKSQAICPARQARGLWCADEFPSHSGEDWPGSQGPLSILPAWDRSLPEPLPWALLTHRSVLNPSAETAWKITWAHNEGDAFWDSHIHQPAHPGFLHFPASSSLSILCFWYHQMLLKEHVHYQAEKHFVRTFFSSKVQFPLPTVQSLQSVLSVPGPKYCGARGAG